jgi:hypothetical protein
VEIMETQIGEGVRIRAMETPVPTPLPIIEGQMYEQGDPNVPEVSYTENGDDHFGYGPIAGEDELYLMWVTDDNGKHYLVIDGTSEMLHGNLDAEGNRIDNGFDDFISERKVVTDQIENSEEEGWGSLGGASIITALLSFCPATGGGGCIGAGLVAIGIRLGNTGRNIIKLDNLGDDLAEIESKLEGNFLAIEHALSS